MSIKKITNLLFFLLLPCGFLHTFINFTGLYIINAVKTFLIVCLLLILIGHLIRNKTYLHFSKQYVGFLIIYLIYVAFVINDIYIAPKMPISEMLGVSSKNLQELFILTTPMFLVNIINENVDYKMIGKLWVVINTAFALIYLSQVDFRLYFLSDNTSFYQDLGMIHPFSLAGAGATALIINIVLKDDWTKSELLNKLIFWGFLICDALILILATKRGPILFTGMAICLYYLYRGMLSRRAFVIVLILVLSHSFIIQLFQQIAPDLTSRFFDIAEDNGSGRFGDETSLYTLSYNQIMSSPYFGSYFRITDRSTINYGAYPHNFFLESLMTFGVFFSIYFWKKIWNAFKMGIDVIRNKSNLSIIFVVFVQSFLFMQTTGTIYNATQFWLSTALILAYNSEFIKCTENEY